MTDGQGPAGSRRRLGAELRRLRTNAGLHLDQVAERVPCSTSKISRLETGKGSPKLVDVQKLMEIYGVTSEVESEMLLRLVRDGRGRGWWEPYTDGVTPERFVLDDSNRYIALEADARAIHSFDVVALHGLLQTRGYADAVLRALLPHHHDAEIAQLVELRMRRQEALISRDPRLEFSAVVDESLLGRVVGGPAVMAEQLAVLRRIARLPNIDVRVFPYSAGWRRAHVGHFAIMEFAAEGTGDLVYIESAGGDQYLESDSDVALYKDVLADVAERALPSAASLELVDHYVDALARKADP